MKYGAIFGVIMAGALAGCAPSEADLRAELGQWFKLAEADHFKTTWDCVAAEFVTETDGRKKALRPTGDMAKALKMLKNDERVAIEVPGWTPNEISEWIASRDLAMGIAVVTAGASAQSCMSEMMKTHYYEALHSREAVVVFDRPENAIIIYDANAGRVFYASKDM